MPITEVGSNDHCACEADAKTADASKTDFAIFIFISCKSSRTTQAALWLLIPAYGWCNKT